MQCSFDLIIFDCDGVLVDSEPVANAIFARVLKEECGLHFSLEEMFDRFVGRSQAQCLQIVEDLTGEIPPSGLADRYKREINLELANSVVAVNGIETVLQHIRYPLLCCLEWLAGKNENHAWQDRPGKIFQPQYL